MQKYTRSPLPFPFDMSGFKAAVVADETITKTFGYICTHEQDEEHEESCIEVTFEQALDAPEEAQLDQLITDYSVEPTAESPLAIESLLDEGQKSGDFRVVDYKAGLLARLHKVVTEMYRGELREVRYYTDESESTLAIVVRVCSDEDCTQLGYVRNSLGSPVERWTERTWYREDGTVHPDKKITKKVYSHDAISQMTEGFRRRQNQIDKLSVDILQAYVATTAVDPQNPTGAEMQAAYDAVTSYNDKYEAGITTFIRVGRNDFLTPPDSPNVTDDTETWLDNSVTPLGYPEGWTIRTIVLESVKNINDV